MAVPGGYFRGRYGGAWGCHKCGFSCACLGYYAGWSWPYGVVRWYDCRNCRRESRYHQSKRKGHQFSDRTCSKGCDYFCVPEKAGRINGSVRRGYEPSFDGWKWLCLFLLWRKLPHRNDRYLSDAKCQFGNWRLQESQRRISTRAGADYGRCKRGVLARTAGAGMYRPVDLCGWCSQRKRSKSISWFIKRVIKGQKDTWRDGCLSW